MSNIKRRKGMFCKKCGKEILDEAVICPNCGVQVKEINGQTKSEDVNGMAIAGFICSFFVPILGWIFGGIGLSKSAKKNGKGKGLSLAALCIATVSFIVGLAML